VLRRDGDQSLPVANDDWAPKTDATLGIGNNHTEAVHASDLRPHVSHCGSGM
jgi:hypothetical protein